MKRNVVIAVALVLLVVGALAGTKFLQIHTLVEAGKKYVQPPETVSSAVAHPDHWQDTIEVVGSITAVQGVDITPEVAGIVSEIHFESGAVVARGDLLLCLDANTEKAQLRAAEAQVRLAKMNAERIRELRTNNTVSPSEVDAAETALAQNEASADAIRAAIEKKTIRAPFAGQLGIRQVNLGEYLDAGKHIVSLQALDPVYAVFSLPQQELAQLKIGMPVRISTDTYTNRAFEGKVTAINPDLDPVTRSVRVQATLENPGQLLRPGMFARTAVLLPTEQDVLAVPTTAVLSAPYGNSVFVIEPATNQPAATAGTNGPPLVVKERIVRIGRSRGDFVAIESGLKTGERVVNTGLFKLRSGMSVVENNTLVPQLSENPHPPDR